MLFRFISYIGLICLLLVNCKGVPVSQNAKKVDPILTDILNNSEVELSESVCLGLSLFYPYSIGQDHLFKNKFESCEGALSENEFHLNVQMDDGKFQYTTSQTNISSSLFFKNIEQEKFGLMSFYCQQESSSPLRTKRYRELNANMREYFEFFQSKLESGLLNSNFPCERSEVLDDDAICVRVTRANKVKKGNEATWNVFETEVLSYIIDQNSVLNGYVQFRSRSTKSCSNPNNTVKLTSYLKYQN